LAFPVNYLVRMLAIFRDVLQIGGMSREFFETCVIIKRRRLMLKANVGRLMYGPQHQTQNNS